MKRILGGFEFVHYEEAAGDLAFGLGAFAIRKRWLADGFVEESTEGAKALKTDFETDVRYAKLVAAEQFFRFLDATFDQVLVRSFIERLPKQTQEVITRETSLL